MHITVRKKYILPLLFLAAVFFIFLALRQPLTIRNYTLSSTKTDTPIRLLQISDLHSTFYGENQEELLQAIAEADPDAILLTGDIADDHVPHDGTKKLLENIASTYPCFYVSGNHEFWSNDIDNIKSMIASYGVTILEGSTEQLTVNGQTIQICGVDDPDGLTEKQWQTQLDACAAQTNDTVYTVLLSHRPERYAAYQNKGFDLILSGHAHGGQVRLPMLLNGLWAPNQGLFPDYAGGIYTESDSTMIVSRGLCRNDLPRVFNPPELVVIDILPQEKTS